LPATYSPQLSNSVVETRVNSPQFEHSVSTSGLTVSHQSPRINESSITDYTSASAYHTSNSPDGFVGGIPTTVKPNANNEGGEYTIVKPDGH
jgi:hypothetical protein